MTDTNSFTEAKGRLGIALDGIGDTITISRTDAEILKGSWPPDNVSLPSGSCRFDASLVPFLASAIDHNCFRYFEVGGISVIPHILGGVHLVATNGVVACIAYDPKGKAPESGMRLMLPRTAIDLCKKQKPISFESCGAEYRNELPDWCQPGLVTVLGGVVMISPKNTPPDIDLGADESPLFWSSYAETNRLYRSNDFRIGKTFPWTGILSKFKEEKSVARYSVGVSAMARATDAMDKSSVEFWDILPRGGITVFIPTDPISPKLAIVLANAKGGERFLSPVSGLPEWLDEAVLGAPDQDGASKQREVRDE